MADLKQSGTMPVVREVFMILVMTGTRASRYCLVRAVGTGSRLQLFEAVSFILIMTLEEYVIA